MVLSRDLVHDAAQTFGVAVGYDGFPVFEQDRGDAARRRIVDAGDGFGAGGVRAELRLVGQLLERIVVPELHLHAPVQRPPLLRIVGGHGLRRPAAVALDGGVGQAQIVLDGEGNAPGHRLGEPDGVAVDALVPPLQRGVVGIADELDHKVLLAAEIVQRLPDLLQKFLRHGQHAFVVMKGGSQVLDARAMGVAFLVAQFADGLGAADLDAVHSRWGTITSFSTSFSPISSYQTSTSTRRLSCRPSSVALLATGWLSPSPS